LRLQLAGRDDGSGFGGDRDDDGDGGDAVAKSTRAGAVVSVAGCPAVPDRSSDALPRCT